MAAEGESMSAHSEKLPPYRGQRVGRIIGTIFITACALMLVLGLTLLSDRLRGPQFILYWSWCFLLTMAAIFVAFWDMLMVRRASKQPRRELFREQFMSKALSEKRQQDKQDNA